MTEFTMKTKDFQKALHDQQLIGARCLDCGCLSVPQREICPNCLSINVEVSVLSGAGKLAAFTVIYVPSQMMAEAGYNGKNPYCVGIVELDEGPSVSAQILDLDLSQPESIKIGSKLSMTTVIRNEGDNEAVFLAFKPA